ncbi:hypothetical protein PO124_31360 [Bacillus licheniformis]|nr:hypothetical protein [Bacillus licheniformis]
MARKRKRKTPDKQPFHQTAKAAAQAACMDSLSEDEKEETSLRLKEVPC